MGGSVGVLAAKGLYVGAASSGWKVWPKDAVDKGGLEWELAVFSVEPLEEMDSVGVWFGEAPECMYGAGIGRSKGRRSPATSTALLGCIGASPAAFPMSGTGGAPYNRWSFRSPAALALRGIVSVSSFGGDTVRETVRRWGLKLPISLSGRDAAETLGCRK